MQNTVTLDDITRRVADHLGLEEGVVKVRCRKQENVWARQLVSHLGREFGFGYREIGQQIGAKDHTLAVYHARQAGDLISVYPGRRREVEQLEAALKGQS